MLFTATGCSAGEPRSIDPAGVDGLEIPTATPDPADFVPQIDNPYLPLAPGNVWRYDVTEDGEVTETIEVRVTEDTREVAGVSRTPRRSRTERRAPRVPGRPASTVHRPAW